MSLRWADCTGSRARHPLAPPWVPLPSRRPVVASPGCAFCTMLGSTVTTCSASTMAAVCLRDLRRMGDVCTVDASVAVPACGVFLGTSQVGKVCTVDAPVAVVCV